VKIVIIGGGAGGASVAARTRRLNESAQIIIFDKSAYISQATCGMPYYLGGVIKDRARLIVTDPDEFSQILNVDVRTESLMIAVNRVNKFVVVRNLKTGEIYNESYDKLVLAPGGTPIIPDIEGIESPHVFSLLNMQDMDAIKAYIDQHQCKNAVVIGAGLIGLEVADNLHKKNMRVQVIEAGNQALGALDFELATLVHQHLAHNNLRLVLNDSVTAVNKKNITLKSGKKINADLVIVSIGILPSVDLAHKCFLKLGPQGGISVNAGMRTTANDIYALGDSVEVNDLINNEKTLVQLAGPVHKQAQVVATNLVGGHASYKPVQGNSIAKIIDLTVAMTGYSEKTLKKKNISYKKSYIDVPSHAGFYPGATPLIIKLMFAAHTGRILGAQIVGSESVDKRIDVIATAIQFEKTVSDLADLELAYAPQFSAAKDPVNIAGMVAQNMLRHGYDVIYWDEVKQLQKEKAIFIDVRTPEEFALQSLPGSLNIPLENLRQRLDDIPKDRKVVVYCGQGKKGYFAWRVLSQHGFTNIVNLSGGYKLCLCAAKDHNAEPVLGDEKISENDNIYGQDLNDKARLPISSTDKNKIDDIVDLSIDATGLSCPGPILKLSKGIKSINSGQYLLITASDASFYSDVDSWCAKTGNTLHLKEVDKTIVTALIQKQGKVIQH
jgi:NADPH-dependent 2,4-dienoyl-CoA reductase/sulfur reductase-like enzyme/rhodanese-related sulfurtransferase/TusA-related sulfurtransferase